MNTWVLILWLATPNAGGPTSVPGYLTQDACVAAGEYADAAGKLLVSSGYMCIPGPKIEGKRP